MMTTRRTNVEIPERLILVGFILFGLLCQPRSASAQGLFERNNPAVETGNAAAKAGKWNDALAAYNKAAKSIPDRPEVHYNRGLAHLELAQHDKAKAAFLQAMDPKASPTLRAAANYNLGLNMLSLAEKAATEEDHEGAQKLFREAAESFRLSLRAQPGQKDAAWNLELALRRIEQEREKQEQKESEQEDEQNEDEQNEDEQQDKQDGQDEKQDKQDGQDEKQEKQDGQDEQQDKQDGQDEKQDKQDGQDEQQDRPEQQDKPLPQQVQKALDALQDQEKSLQRQRALQRGGQRRVEKDW